ncbi:MAG: hypothetical protein ACI857_001058 [Arenicella sp.]|jgi:hypothetical protein
MENYYLAKSIKSPLIKGNVVSGEIIIQGRSYPENAVEFYKDFLEWFVELKSLNLPSIKCTVDMEYFNTSTAGILFDFIGKVAEYSTHSNVQIVWVYEADDYEMVSKGRSLKETFGDLFILEEKKE